MNGVFIVKEAPEIRLAAIGTWLPAGLDKRAKASLVDAARFQILLYRQQSAEGAQTRASTSRIEAVCAAARSLAEAIRALNERDRLRIGDASDHAGWAEGTFAGAAALSRLAPEAERIADACQDAAGAMPRANGPLADLGLRDLAVNLAVRWQDAGLPLSRSTGRGCLGGFLQVVARNAKPAATAHELRALRELTSPGRIVRNPA